MSAAPARPRSCKFRFVQVTPRGTFDDRHSFTTAEAAAAQTQSFEADVSRLLHLMVHSVYSDRDIFVRELVSNAADACEKLRYEALAQPELIDRRRARSRSPSPSTPTPRR